MQSSTPVIPNTNLHYLRFQFVTDNNSIIVGDFQRVRALGIGLRLHWWT